MKRFALSLLLAGVSALAGAQTIQDALTFAESNYVGSAYSMGMGNAVAAIGGDLGTIGINPAGSAVAGYSQFTITPGLTISATRASYAIDHSAEFGPANRTSKSSFLMPNVGFSMRFEDEDPYTSLKGITFSMVSNTVNSYRSSYGVMGQQKNIGGHAASSKFAEMAFVSTIDGLVAEDMNGNQAYGYDDYNAYWDCIMGYNNGLIHELSGVPGQYVGCTEIVSGTDHYVPDALNQDISVNRLGSKSDLLFNLGFDVNHTWYFGVNLGLPVGSYQNVETLIESADPMDNFPITFKYSNGTSSSTFFRSAAYRYGYSADFEGIYAKFGVIGQPVAGLRVGAALQTPTALTVTESWWHSGKVAYANGDSASGSSKTGSYTYNLTTPWSATLGLAYTFGLRALVSVDYEMQSYNSMKFSEVDGYDSGYFAGVNKSIDDFFGVSHNLRVGAEYKLTPFVAARVGYNLITSPERYFEDEFEDSFKYSDDKSQAWSLGFGYKSRGSFFADAAFKMTSLPDIIYSPYSDYGAYDSVNKRSEFEAPDVYVKRNLFNAVLTLGWRF